ncbi:unnamed protein product, partial [Prorocentrum cordatum]
MRLLLPLLAVLTEIVLNIVDFVFCRLWIWLGVFRGGRRALSKLSASEWIATALVHTWVFLGVYAILGIRLRRWHAKMLVEAEVRRAFQRPFRAKIERNDFLRQTSGPEDNADELDGDPDFDARPPKRSFSDQFLNNVEVLPEMDLRQLEARHAALLLARQAKLEEGFEFAVLPDAMSLEVRRSSLLDDSWSALLSAPDTELLAPRLLVSYVGEDGVDAGGLALDWFDAVGRELTAGAEDADSSSLFALGLSSRMLIPRPHAVGARGQGEEDGRLRRGRQLLAAGRFLALGVVHGGRPLTLPISPADLQVHPGRQRGPRGRGAAGPGLLPGARRPAAGARGPGRAERGPRRAARLPLGAHRAAARGGARARRLGPGGDGGERGRVPAAALRGLPVQRDPARPAVPAAGLLGRAAPGRPPGLRPLRGRHRLAAGRRGGAGRLRVAAVQRRRGGRGRAGAPVATPDADAGGGGPAPAPAALRHGLRPPPARRLRRPVPALPAGRVRRGVAGAPAARAHLRESAGAPPLRLAQRAAGEAADGAGRAELR